jgi:hypothetical protein
VEGRRAGEGRLDRKKERGAERKRGSGNSQEERETCEAKESKETREEVLEERAA